MVLKKDKGTENYWTISNEEKYVIISYCVMNNSHMVAKATINIERKNYTPSLLNVLFENLKNECLYLNKEWTIR